MNSYCRTEVVNTQQQIVQRILRVASALPLILVIALSLRLSYAWEYQHPRSRQALSTIPFLLEPGNIAYSLAVGKGFSSPFRADTGPTAWSTPVYPLLVAGTFRMFGVYTFPSYVASVLVNIFFSTLACVPIFFVGQRIGGVGVAAIAAWLWAVCPTAMIFTVSIWDVSLSALLVVTILWMTLQLSASRGLRNWLAYGFLWGLRRDDQRCASRVVAVFVGLADLPHTPACTARTCAVRRDSVLRALDDPQLCGFWRLHPIALRDGLAIVDGEQ
jgi:hypothetical protein